MALVYPDGEVLWVPPVDIKVKTCVDKDRDKKRETKTKTETVLFIPPVDIKVKTEADDKEFCFLRSSVLTFLIPQDQW